MSSTDIHSDSQPRPRKRTSAGRGASGIAELVPAIVAAVIGVPLVFTFTQAMADGELRRRESPVRAMLGDRAFEQLKAGEATTQHYFGNSLGAPDFTLKDQNGTPWKLSDHRGKVVVMNFWTITCQPCVEEMPSLVALANQAATRDDIELVAVTTDKSWDEVKAIFPPQSKLKVLFDPDRSIVKDKYGTRLFPETWVIDRKGVVRLRVDGAREWNEPLALETISSFL